MEKNGELQTIDIDLIKSLRATGQNSIANKLLRAFREDIQKNKQQLIKEIRNQDYKILGFQCKKLGICRFCKNKVDVKEVLVCPNCRIKYRLSSGRNIAYNKLSVEEKIQRKRDIAKKCYQKNKEFIKIKRRERYAKKKALLNSKPIL